MRILLDESLPRQLAGELTGHDVRTVRQQKWNSMRNGELLARAQVEGFDVFITADQNLEYQQNLARASIGVIVLIARTNRIEDLISLVPDLLETLSNTQPGKILYVASN